MSESNEKIIPQEPEMDLNTTEEVDTKAAREEAQRKAEKRSNILYTAIAVLFVLVAVVTLVWRSNIIQKNSTALTIGDEKYTAGEVNFYFENVYRNFLSQASNMLNSIGLDVSTSLRLQTISEDVAAMIDAKAGQTWHDAFMEQAVKQMIVVKSVVETAEAEGYTYSDGIMAQYEQSIQDLRDTAAAAGVSVDDYLSTSLDPTVTEEIYAEHLLLMMKYTDYASHFTSSLTYTDEELEAVYAANPTAYDLVSYEYVIIDGGAPSTTDAEGNSVAATDEEKAAALEAAKAAAKEMMAAAKAGEDLETLAAANEKATYSYSDEGMYFGDNVTKWLFEDGRKSGDWAHLDNNGTNQYVVHFKNRSRNEAPTIDVRHILFLVEPTLAEGEEGYEAEVEQLMAEARAEAEDVYAQWKAGEATEDSFAALAMEHSDDGNQYSGGLYTQVTQGYMVQEFNDWCFDTSRKTGDTDIVMTDFGAHVMYFVGQNENVWKLDAASVLQSEDASAWFDDMSTRYTATEHSLGMKFVD